ncbi:MAG: GGDEF domain-containing protein [Acidobacteriota bacterium]
MTICYIVIIIILACSLTISVYQRKILKKKVEKELNEAYARMEQLATYDPLTHLYTRKSMRERIEIEMLRMGRSWNPFCIILLDIDDFNSINEKHGPESGDKILLSLSLLLKENLRLQDAASRWGGEEFLLLLPGTPIDGGVILAEKIRKKIEKTKITYGEEEISFTITLGVNVFEKLGPTNDCILGAFHALNHGKKSGKNTTIRADEIPVS